MAGFSTSELKSILRVPSDLARLIGVKVHFKGEKILSQQSQQRGMEASREQPLNLVLLIWDKVNNFSNMGCLRGKTNTSY